MKLKCDEPLLIFAFNFNLRRYNPVNAAWDLWMDSDGRLPAGSPHCLLVCTHRGQGGSPVPLYRLTA